jgi:hypothetical protein
MLAEQAWVGEFAPFHTASGISTVIFRTSLSHDFFRLGQPLANSEIAKLLYSFGLNQNLRGSFFVLGLA